MNTLANRILSTYRKLNYPISVGTDEINICYLEGVNADGIPHADTINHFNDRRIVWIMGTAGPLILGNWQATSEPGLEPTKNPINSRGAARIQFGFYRAWRVGIHQGSNPKNDHEGLIQTGGPVTVCRDGNRDGIRPGDPLHTGYFGINQHHGFNQPENWVGWASAGCLVGRTITGHQDFMKLVKADPRYQRSRAYTFGAAIINGHTQLVK